MRTRAVFLAVFASFAFSFAPSAHAAAPARMEDLITQYDADESAVGQFYDLPWSAVRFDRLDKLYSAWLAKLAAVDFQTLDHSGQVDYVLLRNNLEQSRAGIARDRRRLAEMDELIAIRGAIDELEVARLRGIRVDGQAAATKIGELAAQVKKLKERIEKGKSADATRGGAKHVGAKDQKSDPPPLSVSPVVALRAAAAVAGLRGTLKNWFKFYDGFNPQLSWWLKTPCEDADKQLDEYGKFLREEIAGQKGKDEDPLVGDPIGPAALAAEIRFAFLPYTAGELIAIGERQLAWGEREMKRAAREMGCGDDWKAALARVKSDYVPPGEQDELVWQIGREAIRFVEDRKFATIPPLCAETWHLTMMPPETLRTIPYAAYSGQNVMVAYANESMKQEDKIMVMRGNNRAFTRLTTIHELIPGHHLQMFNAARHNTYRALFSTPFYVEGWALYCELQMWNLGWAHTPQQRIGMLFWRMHRAARIIVSLKFHLGEMKPAEMVEFLVNRVGHERFGATSEVRRFLEAPPLYQAGYLLGGLQLMALHEEMTGPGKMTDRQFHDALLAENTMPVEILRDDLLKLPLSRDAKPLWRFAGEHPQPQL